MHIAHRHNFVVAYLWHHRKNVIRKAKVLWEMMFSYNRKENHVKILNVFMDVYKSVKIRDNISLQVK